MNKNAIHTLAFDLDGTLLNSDKEISETSLHVISELKNRGYHIVFISDRRLSGIEPYAKQFDLNEDDYIVCRNGIYIYNGKRELIKKGGFIGTKDIKKAAKFSSDEKIYFYTDSLDFSCSITPKITTFRKRIKSIICFKERKTELLSLDKKKKSINIRDLRYLSELQIEKARLYCKNLSELEKQYTVYRVVEYPGMSDVFNKKINKYLALQDLYGMKNKSLLNGILYFGDDMNDIDCFKNLKYTVAMGNAKEEIKQLAYYVTDNCDNDGIYKAILSLGLC